MGKYFLKCDISGIQSFIFNVPSSGAARALKNRSFYITLFAEECFVKLKNYFGENETKVLYHGGGNFYLKINTNKSEADINKFIEENIYKEKISHDIFAYVSFIEDKGESIDKLLNGVNVKINIAKMQRPLSFNLLNARPVIIENIDFRSINSINRQVPAGDFTDIANHSEGDSKLAALKLDVDNLGQLFIGRSEKDYQIMSDGLKAFFDDQLLQLIKDLKMQQNIYVVFSGGDDCFLIGSWNKILDLAILLRKKFYDFQLKLKSLIADLPKDEITFSAGIIVFQPHYPMLQLANEVEHALNSSKLTNGKNCVTIFDKTMKWSEFEKAQTIKDSFIGLLINTDEKKQESKSFLQIFRKIYPLNNELPKVWRLKYFLQRNVKKGNREIVKPLFDNYSQSLLQQHVKYSGNNAVNPNIYLVSSRWAELLLK